MLMASFDLGVKNFAYCIASVEDRDICVQHIEVLNVNQPHWLDTCRAITHLLKKIPLCDVFLIEQQPGNNVRMQKCAQHVWSTLTLLYPQARVVFVSARIKFDKGERMTYRQRKQWSVDKIMTQSLPIDLGPVLSRLVSLPKKDDACDAILQLVGFVQKGG